MPNGATRRFPVERLPSPLEAPERLDRGAKPDDPRPKERPRLPELNPEERDRLEGRVPPDRRKDGRERPSEGRDRPAEERERPSEGRDRPPEERDRPREGRAPPRERLMPPERLMPRERPTLLERPTLPRCAVAASARMSRAPRRRHASVTMGCFMIDPPKTNCPAATFRDAVSELVQGSGTRLEWRARSPEVLRFIRSSPSL